MVLKTVTLKNVEALTVFLQQPLSRLTFPKVFCLQTPLSDLKVMAIFTSKIIFPWRNLTKERWWINQFERYCGISKWSLCLRSSSYMRFTRFVCVGRRNPFPKRLRMLALRGRRGIVAAYFHHSQRLSICHSSPPQEGFWPLFLGTLEDVHIFN